MTYDEARAFIDSFLNLETVSIDRSRLRTLNLARMSRVLSAVGDPHQRLPFVHVAGTKGKGSTCAFIDSALRHAGFRVGLYTSPHLVSPRERMQIDGRWIGEDEFAALVGELASTLESLRTTPDGGLTFFEVYTTMALVWFAAQACDIVVLEVGMGGRLDATNVVTPVMTVITPIGLDHMEALGNTVDKIAREKAGIIKAGCPLVLASQPHLAREAIRAVAEERNAPVLEVGADIQLRRHRSTGGRERCDLGIGEVRLEGVSLRLVGAHQVGNAATALGALHVLTEHGWHVPDDAIRAGFEAANLPGRFQVVSRENLPRIVLDCAHTAESASALRASLLDQFPSKSVAFIVGMSRDKDHAAFARELAPVASSITVSRTHGNARAAEPSRLAEAWEACGFDVTYADSVAHALSRLDSHPADHTVICVTGSVFFVGEALQGVNPLFCCKQ